jgi:hypothetical protein
LSESEAGRTSSLLSLHLGGRGGGEAKSSTSAVLPPFLTGVTLTHKMAPHSPAPPVLLRSLVMGGAGRASSGVCVGVRGGVSGENCIEVAARVTTASAPSEELMATSTQKYRSTEAVKQKQKEQSVYEKVNSRNKELFFLRGECRVSINICIYIYRNKRRRSIQSEVIESNFKKSCEEN